MYSVRRLSVRPPVARPDVNIDTHQLAEANKIWGSTGSIPSTPVPIPLSAAPNTPLAGMTIGTSDVHEPRRDLILNLIVVRHGETDLNKRRPRVVQGQMDVPLNAHGTKQALMLAHRLSKVKIDYIYSSDLTRARQTAEEIARVHNKTVLHDSRLREQSLGDLTGQLWSAAKARLKQVDKNFEGYLMANQGETSEVVKERIVQSYIDVVEKHLLNPNRIMLPRSGSGNFLTEQYGPVTPVSGVSGPSNSPLTTATKPARPTPRTSTVVLVTHGGPIRQLINHFVADLGFTYHPKVVSGRGKRTKSKHAARLPCEPRMTQFPHTASIFQIRLTRRYTAGEYDWCGHVVKFNDTSHLACLNAWTVHCTTPQNIKLANDTLRLVRVSKYTKEPEPKKTLSVRSPAGRAKQMGMRMIGKLMGSPQLQHMPQDSLSAMGSPKPEEKRKKSLGW